MQCYLSRYLKHIIAAAVVVTDICAAVIFSVTQMLIHCYQLRYKKMDLESNVLSDLEMLYRSIEICLSVNLITISLPRLWGESVALCKRWLSAPGCYLQRKEGLWRWKRWVLLWKWWVTRIVLTQFFLALPKSDCHFANIITLIKTTYTHLFVFVFLIFLKMHLETWPFFLGLCFHCFVFYLSSLNSSHLPLNSSISWSLTFLVSAGWLSFPFWISLL